MKRRYAAAGAAAIAALAVVLSACSSDGGATQSSGSPAGAGGSGSAASGASAPAAEGTPIKVGVMCSCSNYVYAGQQVAIIDTYKAFVTKFNAEGGVNGHKIELVEKDDQSNPGVALTSLKELLDADVDVILDSSNVDSAWSQEIPDAKVPVVGTNINNRSFATNPYFFPEGMTVDYGTKALVQAAKDAGTTKVGVLYCAETPSCQELAPAVKSVAVAAGLQVVYTGSAAATAPNFTAQCLAAKQAGVDGLLMFLGGQTVSRVGPDCKRQNWDVAYFTLGSGYFPQQAESEGIKDNWYGVFAYYPLFGGGPVEEIYTELAKDKPGLTDDKENWSQSAIGAWFSGKLLAKAVELSGAAPEEEITPEVVLSGLYKIKDETLGGGVPKLTFTKGAKTNSVACYFVGRLTDGGKSSVENDGKPACVK